MVKKLAKIPDLQKDDLKCRFRAAMATIYFVLTG
jgi:hypothetical protein